jgi:hypothetical protein
MVAPCDNWDNPPPTNMASAVTYTESSDARNNEQAIVITREYTQVLCDKGICSPGLSDMGMYRRISLYRRI